MTPSTFGSSRNVSSTRPSVPASILDVIALLASPSISWLKTTISSTWPEEVVDSALIE